MLFVATDAVGRMAVFNSVAYEEFMVARLAEIFECQEIHGERTAPRTKGPL
jgi:hypothetical protein